MMGICGRCQRPHSASCPRFVSRSSGTAISRPLMTCPLLFYHDSSTSSSSPSASQRVTWSACSVAVLHSSNFVFRRSMG